MESCDQLLSEWSVTVFGVLYSYMLPMLLVVALYQY